jgi:hypothetical protein
MTFILWRFASFRTEQKLLLLVPIGFRFGSKFGIIYQDKSSLRTRNVDTPIPLFTV